MTPEYFIPFVANKRLTCKSCTQLSSVHLFTNTQLEPNLRDKHGAVCLSVQQCSVDQKKNFSKETKILTARPIFARIFRCIGSRSSSGFAERLTAPYALTAPASSPPSASCNTPLTLPNATTSPSTPTSPPSSRTMINLINRSTSSPTASTTRPTKSGLLGPVGLARIGSSPVRWIWVGSSQAGSDQIRFVIFVQDYWFF